MCVDLNVCVCVCAMASPKACYTFLQSRLGFCESRLKRRHCNDKRRSHTIFVISFGSLFAKRFKQLTQKKKKKRRPHFISFIWVDAWLTADPVTDTDLKVSERYARTWMINRMLFGTVGQSAFACMTWLHSFRTQWVIFGAEIPTLFHWWPWQVRGLIVPHLASFSWLLVELSWGREW